MPRNRESGFIDQLHAARGQTTHPHLDPINQVTFSSDASLAVSKVGALIGYQKYLVAARAAKAKRKGSSPSFEHNVQVQARQALGDFETFSGAALRVVQQVNQTNLWGDMLNRATTALRTKGPQSARQIWSELRGNAQIQSALETHGLTKDVVSMVTDMMQKFDATLALQDDKVAIESRVTGESRPRRLVLEAAPGRPRSITDLLWRSQFDDVVTAFTKGDPVYLEATAGAGAAECDPGQLFAVGAVAARQRIIEHVRKLEDTGLATYEGNDPVTLIVTALAIGLFFGVVGTTILYLCDHPGEVIQPDYVCTAGFVLVYLAAMILGAVLLVAVGEAMPTAIVLGGLGFGWSFVEVLEHWLGFSPAPALA